MRALTIDRVLEGGRRGSSRPILVATSAGTMLVKLRGAAQGPGALVAEIIVAALAEVLELRVPARRLVVLERDVVTDDRDQELGDLLAASVGLNLGFAVLDEAQDFEPSDLHRIPPADAAAILWLDRLVFNPDRTAHNPNLLWWDDRLWLIDHGAALRFHYDWSAVTEATPREIGMTREPHVFETASDSDEWSTWDSVFSGRLTRAALEAAVATVPADFLLPLIPGAHAGSPAEQAEALRRRRAAYVAFLWKRLKPPRAFVNHSPVRVVGSPE